MKKSLFTLAICIGSLNAYSQSSSGLIAHWDFNGESNDVTGNGHTGHAVNTIDTAGITGASHTAYYFNGINSVVTASYAPDLNLTKFSLCATIKPTGFYPGTCLTNTIFARGVINPHNGIYDLFFTNVINECYTFDSTGEVFGAESGPNLAIPTLSAFNYTPAIIKNIWYKVVATYDSTYWRIYVNGTLKSTVSGYSYPIGFSTDSISIGMSVYDALVGYPYNFKGIIDDIRLYNRVLSDSEVIRYGDSCGAITLQPLNSTVYIGGNAIFTANTSFSIPAYQWQQDGGTGFVNLTNSSPYSGVNTDTLTITGATSALNNYHYRCLITNELGCSDMTNPATLTVTLGVSNILTANLIKIFPNPAINNTIIELPYQCNKGNVQMINELGQIILRKNIQGNSAQIDFDQQIPSGLYMLKLNFDGMVVYKKIIKE